MVFFSYLVMNYGDTVLGHFSSVRPVHIVAYGVLNFKIKNRNIFHFQTCCCLTQVILDKRILHDTFSRYL